jgi:Zn-dependent protease
LTGTPWPVLVCPVPDLGEGLSIVNFDPVSILFWFIIFLFSLSVHESAHAWVSDRFGDDTGRLLGRISLNPIVHIDPVGTILFPLISSLTGFPLFGWAKPVPVNPLRWREKNKANFWVSAAGPLSNIALAVMFFVVAKSLVLGHRNNLLDIGTGSSLEPVFIFCSMGIFVNVGLAIFNLIPIPPLDGSGVLESILPYEAQKSYEQLRPYGFILLYGLMFLGVFSLIFGPVYRLVQFLLFL